jgi:thimet oligopeptidase
MTVPPVARALPSDTEGWLAFVAESDARLSRIADIDAELIGSRELTTRERLERWNETEYLFGEISGLWVVAEAHPDPVVRTAAEERVQAAESTAAARLLDERLWAVFADLDADGLDPLAARVLDFLRRDFRRGGVALDAAGRERVRELAARDTELSLTFARNVREGRREITVEPERLAGLPQDFIDAHPVGDDGLVRLTTEYPDLMPVMDYARDRATRMALVSQHNLVGWPENADVLAELLAVRAERAALLGYADWAEYETEPRMIGSGAAIPGFLDGVDRATRDTALAEYDIVLARLREESPETDAVTIADLWYTVGAIKRERFDVDAKLVRSYLPFARVLDGVLATTGRLLDLEYVSVDTPAWHEEVRTYDVFRGGSLLGRIHLDLHPREGKFGHAACFPLSPGRDGESPAEGALLCNFSRGLMEHDEVVTFFHEFGHLVHYILSSTGEWARLRGIQNEWDFVEAPSQMLEEWAWDPDVLASFTADETGAPIPGNLVARMRTADGFARALAVRRQLGYAQVSYHLHVDRPADLQAATEHWFNAMSPVRLLPDLHPYAGFGHLTGYGACYYTYEWSQVIARDLLSAFGDDLMDSRAARRYREEILERGATRDAADMVESFLGRPYAFDAYAQWVAGGD